MAPIRLSLSNVLLKAVEEFGAEAALDMKGGGSFERGEIFQAARSGAPGDVHNDLLTAN